ncbi:MAG: polysaccharide deacetylase family protein [Veillonellales bacterium]
MSSLLAASGLEITAPLLLSRSAASQKIPILLYHRVGYTTDQLTVTPERFSNDLALLADYGYQAISLRQFQTFLLGNDADLPEQPVLITLDDGYSDNYENAFPILQNFGISATFFIITGLLWTPGRLTPEQLREMAGSGMCFGSHTVTHRPLATLSSQEAEEELNSSRSTLESILGTPVDTIAYPCGSYNDTIIQIAQNNGYHEGLTVRNGTCSTNSPLFELRRIPVFRYDSGILSVIASRS